MLCCSPMDYKGEKMNQLIHGDIWYSSKRNKLGIVSVVQTTQFYIFNNICYEATYNAYIPDEFIKLGNIVSFIPHLSNKIVRTSVNSVEPLSIHAIPNGTLFIECLVNYTRLCNFIGIKLNDNTYVFLSRNGHYDILNTDSTVIPLGHLNTLLEVSDEKFNGVRI